MTQGGGVNIVVSIANKKKLNAPTYILEIKEMVGAFRVLLRRVHIKIFSKYLLRFRFYDLCWIANTLYNEQRYSHQRDRWDSQEWLGAWNPKNK